MVINTNWHELHIRWNKKCLILILLFIVLLTFCNWMYNSAKNNVVLRTLCASFAIYWTISRSLYCNLQHNSWRNLLSDDGSILSSKRHKRAPVYRKFCSSIDWNDEMVKIMIWVSIFSVEIYYLPVWK